MSKCKVQIGVSGGRGKLSIFGVVTACPPELEQRVRNAVAWFETRLQEKIDAATREQANRKDQSGP